MRPASCGTEQSLPDGRRRRRAGDVRGDGATRRPVEVSAPIVGASRLAHLDDAIAALDLTLSEDEIARLEAPYVPHAVVGFS